MDATVSELKAQLDAIDPRLWVIFWAFIVGGVVYTLKRFGLWKKVPSQIKVPMSAVLGALLTTIGDTMAADVDVAKVMLDAAIGAFSGLMATGGHQFWARMGATKPTTKESEEAS